MKILRIQKPNPETGELELVVALTEEQTQFLIDLALNYLVQRGIATFQDPPQQVEAMPTLEEAMIDVMKEAKPEDLPQA